MERHFHVLHFLNHFPWKSINYQAQLRTCYVPHHTWLLSDLYDMNIETCIIGKKVINAIHFEEHNAWFYSDRI